MNNQERRQVGVVTLLLVIFCIMWGFIVRSCIEEVHVQLDGGVKPLIAEIWCGSEDCLNGDGK